MSCMRVCGIFTKLDIVYLRETFFYIYIRTYQSFKWKRTYIQKHFTIIISLSDGGFFSCEVSFALIVCVDNVRHLCFTLQKMHTYAYVYLHNNKCNSCIYIGVSFWCTFGYPLMEFVKRPCFC